MRLTTAAVVVTALLMSACAGSVIVHKRPPRPPRAPRPGPVQTHPAHLGIPPGHLPPAGMCRIWYPGRPPGHQPKAGSCKVLDREVPPGAWLVYRPSGDRKVVRVAAYHASRRGSVVAVRVYDADTGRFLSVETAARTR